MRILFLKYLKLSDKRCTHSQFGHFLAQSVASGAGLIRRRLLCIGWRGRQPGSGSDSHSDSLLPRALRRFSVFSGRLLAVCLQTCRCLPEGRGFWKLRRPGGDPRAVCLAFRPEFSSAADAALLLLLLPDWYPAAALLLNRRAISAKNWSAPCWLLYTAIVKLNPLKLQTTNSLCTNLIIIYYMHCM